MLSYLWIHFPFECFELSFLFSGLHIFKSHPDMRLIYANKLYAAHYLVWKFSVSKYFSLVLMFFLLLLLLLLMLMLMSMMLILLTIRKIKHNPAVFDCAKYFDYDFPVCFLSFLCLRVPTAINMQTPIEKIVNVWMLMVLNRTWIQNQNYILETDKRTEKSTHPQTVWAKRVNERINIETLYPF